MSINLSFSTSIDWYATIVGYYTSTPPRYNNDDVAFYVFYQKISPLDYKKITGEDYLVYLDNAYKANKIDKTYLQKCVTEGLITQAEYNIIIA